MGFKYMRIRPWCPTVQFRTLLQIQQHSVGENNVMGSTVWWNGKPPTSLWDSIKNVLYTEYLRIRICLHPKCESCTDV
jgi:hypothetical protein